MSTHQQTTNSKWTLAYLTIVTFIFAIGISFEVHAQIDAPSEQGQLDEISLLEAEEELLNELEYRLELEEYEDVIDAAQELIDEIEVEGSFYDDALVRPLLIVGDGSRKLGKYVEALEAYDRAKHITRLNHGLTTIEQIEVVKREATTYEELGQLGKANDAYEYIFTVYNQVYKPFSKELLPSLFDLGDWYVKTYNVFAARGLFEYAQVVAKEHLDEQHPHNIRALYSLALTYRLEKFRPPSSAPMIEADVPRLYWGDGRPYIYYAELNNFAEGEKALIELVRIELERPGSTRESQTLAKLALADWFVLFDKQVQARAVYSDIWKSYDEEPDDEFMTENFTAPVILHNPLPADPEPNPQDLDTLPVNASVTYLLDIDKRGRVQAIDVEILQPDSSFTKDFTRQISQAIFRPAFVNGKPVNSVDVSFTHDYVFYVKEESD